MSDARLVCRLKADGYICVTHGLRGWFAVHVRDGEPWQTGSDSHETPEEAERDARDWADAEGLEFRPDTSGAVK